MAKNQVHPDFFQNSYPVPTGTESDDPLIIGGVPVVALEDEGNVTTGYATCRSIGSFDLSVAAVDDSGNTTVAYGDDIFYNAADTPVLSKKASGIKFGKAVEAISTVGATATIEVRLGQWESIGASGRGTYCEFETAGATSAAAGGVASGVAGTRNVIVIDGINFEYSAKGTQTITVPPISALGLDIGAMDQTADDGIEINRGVTARNPESFLVGTDGAFFARCRFTLTDVSGTDDCAFGFRKVEANQANIDDYDEMAVLNVISGDIKIETILNAGATTTTDTTDNWADLAEHELEVNVSAAGVVTYKIDGAAPTVTAAFTFDTGERVMPFFFFLQDTDIAGAVPISKWQSGLA